MLGVVVLLAAIDLIVKAWAANGLPPGRSIDLKLIQLRVTFNSGVAFSFGSGLPKGVLVGVTSLIILLATAAAWRAAPTSRPVERISIAAVIGGGLGNLIDRSVDGVVTDYLHTGWFPTFNLADVFITIGVGALLLTILPGAESVRGKTGQNDGE